MRRGMDLFVRPFCLAGVLWAVALQGAGSPVSAALPPGENVVPAASRLFVTWRNIGQLKDSVSKSMIGQLLNDPKLKPFADDVRKQIEERIATADVRLGVSFDDIKDLTTGQVTMAIVPLAADAEGKAQTGIIIVVEATNPAQLQALRQKVANEMAQRKAVTAPFQSTTGAAGTYYRVPPQKEGRREAPIVEAVQTVGGDQAWLIGNNPAIVEAASSLLAGGAGPALRNDATFQKVMAESAPAAGETAAQVVAFVEPLGLAEALRAWEWPPKKHKPDGIAVLRHAGFDQLRGFGGQLAFSVGDYGMMVRLSGFAPPPWQKSMNMLTFVPSKDNAANVDFSPQPWVGANAAAYASVYYDVLKAFDHFGPLFDGFLEDEGIWDDVVKSMIEDPDGPKIDIREEFFKLLGQRATALVECKQPAQADSTQYLLAIEVADPQKMARVAGAMKKAFANDPSVEAMKLGELDVYKIIATEEVPANSPNQEGVVDGKRQLVSALVTAANGYVFIASDASILQKVLGPVPAHPLATAPDFVAVTAELGKFLPQPGGDLVGLGFVRVDELVSIDYELFRTGRMRGSQTILGRILDLSLVDNEKPGPREMKLDGTKLPPFEEVRKYFTPLGLLLRKTADGWSLVGLTHDKPLPREAANAAAPTGGK
jgi:hypothetical protein